MVSGTHLSEHENYRRLNDSMRVGEGEVRTLEDGTVELVIDWFKVVWEPLAENWESLMILNTS